MSVNYAVKMKKQSIFFFLLLSFCACFLTSCKDPDPSVAKVFVRNSFKELLVGVEVLIVADADNFPAYDEKRMTNSSGYASFNLEDYFSQFSEEAPKISDFKIYLNIEGKLEEVGSLRTRANVTSVETVFFNIQ